MLNPLICDLELKSSLNIKEKMKNGTKVTDKVTDKNNKKKRWNKLTDQTLQSIGAHMGNQELLFKI